MKILIIEDEKLASDHLIRLLKKIPISIELVGVLHSVREAKEWLTSHNPPDLILSDIELSDGLSFDVFEKYDQHIPVVFITAYDQYALNAFKINAIDYLLKPVGEIELLSALRKYDNVHASYKRLTQSLLLQLRFELQSKSKRRFVVKSGDKISSIEIVDIVFFYVKDKNTYLYSKDKKAYIIMYTFEQLEEVLDRTLFFRVNRQFIINHTFIDSMKSFSSNRMLILLKNDLSSPEEIVVSKERLPFFKEWLDQ